MSTVGQHGGMIFPVGIGIGATQLAWAVMSPMRAAGMLQIMTVAEPLEIIPGPAGTQGGGPVHGMVVSATRAAGMLPIITVGAPLTMASGMGGWGTGVGTGAGGWIGAWQCGPSCRTMSVTRAAGLPT